MGELSQFSIVELIRYLMVPHRPNRAGLLLPQQPGLPCSTKQLPVRLEHLMSANLTCSSAPVLHEAIIVS